MELYDLEYGLKSIASAGFVLNCQEVIALQAGLTILRSNEKYDNIYLWGKSSGKRQITTSRTASETQTSSSPRRTSS